MSPTTCLVRFPQPELTAVSPAVPGQRPIHQRIWEIERRREQNLRLLRAEKEEREATTFAPPPLSRMSNKLTRDSRSAAARGWDHEALRSRPCGRHSRKWKKKEVSYSSCARSTWSNRCFRRLLNSARAPVVVRFLGRWKIYRRNLSLTSVKVLSA